MLLYPTSDRLLFLVHSSTRRYSDTIIVIDPNSGAIIKTLDFGSLYPQRSRPKRADCFNGIAYNKTDETFILTGKFWPKYFRVKIPLEDLSRVAAAEVDKHEAAVDVESRDREMMGRRERKRRKYAVKSDEQTLLA